MKKIIFFLLIMAAANTSAQTKKSDESPKDFVEEFFKAFHEQDTLALKNMALEGVQLQSISINTEGKKLLNSEPFEHFLKSIASIPADSEFEERLLNFKVEENGPLAVVNTAYEFYYNGNFSHCGVNNFTLVKLEDQWKIVHLIDTRNKKCD
ncbi:MAG: nuclear transport factor 2 family protein [Bacteroidota bacterium]|nr:nuclear transport factor 2 family protein [Bacteroidota bacterium]